VIERNISKELSLCCNLLFIYAIEIQRLGIQPMFLINNVKFIILILFIIQSPFLHGCESSLESDPEQETEDTIDGNESDGEWELVWSDEFDGGELDTEKWSFQLGTGTEFGLTGWGNYELQYYTNAEENIFTEDGKLHIVAREESHGGMNYTSARIRTYDKGDWKYGRFEIRAKLPEGQGIWPAIWMLPTDEVFGGWPKSGEIDIMELVGHEPETIHGTVHYGPDWPNNQFTGTSYRLSEGKFSDDFHIFSIEWREDEIKWFVDGEHFFTVTPSSLQPHNYPFNERFHLLINLAVGGNWPGSPDATTEFPQSLIVDYVRVYQLQ
jgi:beta-glucanase (GH16 family)